MENDRERFTKLLGGLIPGFFTLTSVFRNLFFVMVCTSRRIGEEFFILTLSFAEFIKAFVKNL
jgi:hypothetical protein